MCLRRIYATKVSAIKMQKILQDSDYYTAHRSILHVTRIDIENITVDWSKLEIVLYTLFSVFCPTKFTVLYRTVSTFSLCSS